MSTKLIVQFALVAASAYSVVAKPALAAPDSGTYRIQNIGTGLFLDDFNIEQGLGTPVIVQTINQPLTSNQEWHLTVFSGGTVAILQSISSYVNTDGGSGVILNPSGPVALTISSAPSGVFICASGSTDKCFTSSPTPVTQVSLERLTGELDQTWVFEFVG